MSKVSDMSKVSEITDLIKKGNVKLLAESLKLWNPTTDINQHNFLELANQLPDEAKQMEVCKLLLRVGCDPFTLVDNGLNEGKKEEFIKKAYRLDYPDLINEAVKSGAKIDSTNWEFSPKWSNSAVELGLLEKATTDEYLVNPNRNKTYFRSEEAKEKYLESLKNSIEKGEKNGKFKGKEKQLEEAKKHIFDKNSMMYQVIPKRPLNELVNSVGNYKDKQQQNIDASSQVVSKDENVGGNFFQSEQKKQEYLKLIDTYIEKPEKLDKFTKEHIEEVKNYISNSNSVIYQAAPKVLANEEANSPQIDTRKRSTVVLMEPLTFIKSTVAFDNPVFENRNIYSLAGVEAGEHPTNVAGVFVQLAPSFPITLVNEDGIGLDTIKDKEKVINMSFGSTKTTTDHFKYQKEIFTQMKNNVENSIFIKALGNESSSINDKILLELIANDPILSKKTILISAVGIDGKNIAKYSSIPGLDKAIQSITIAAPGNIMTTKPTKSLAEREQEDPGRSETDYLVEQLIEGFSAEKGTSMAAPVVTALAANLSEDFPTLTQNEIVEVIKNSTNKGFTIDASYAGNGLVDFKNAYDVARQYIIEKERGLDTQLPKTTLDPMQIIKEQEYVDPKGNTTLIASIDLENQEVANKLLQKSANPNGASKDGVERIIPLHHATKQQNVEMVELLLKHNAEVDIKNAEGITALHYAARKGDKEIANLLLEANASVDILDNNQQVPLHYAVNQGNSNMVEFLLEHNANINSKDKDGMTPLHCAVLDGEEGVVEKLLNSQKLDVNLKDNEGMTPLHWAARNGHTDITRLLLGDENNSSINTIDKNGKTPLHYAAKEGELEVVELLIEKGADVNSLDKEGKTAFSYAASNDDEDKTEQLSQIKELLVKKDVDTKLENRLTKLIDNTINPEEKQKLAKYVKIEKIIKQVNPEDIKAELASIADKIKSKKQYPEKIEKKIKKHVQNNKTPSL